MKSKIIQITKVETEPEIDPYHAQTGGETYTELYIDPERGIVQLHQEMDDNATPIDEWNGLVIASKISGHPNRSQALWVLEEDAHLIERVVNGHSTEWDGHNWIGKLNHDAESALEELIQDLENCDPEEVGLYSCDDWFDSCTPKMLGISWFTTDDEIKEIATKLEADAYEEGAILYGSVSDYLIRLRDDLQENIE